MNSQNVIKTILAAAALMSLPIVPAAASVVPGRATWVWRTAEIRDDSSKQADFFNFLNAPQGQPEHAITTVFFDGMHAADFQDPAAVAQMHSFLVTAHAHKMTVDFLCGDPTWATAEGQSEGTDMLKSVIAFNESSPKAGRFDGFQYDVEPYSLPGWPSTDLQNGLLALFDASNTLISASNQKLVLAAAIPRWFGNPDLDFLDRKIIDRIDEVDVMDYVTNQDRLINDPSDILTYASSKHKSVWIGVETGPLPSTPRTTFYGTGDSGMESMLAAALPSFTAQSSFRGYAIHDSATYETLKP